MTFIEASKIRDNQNYELKKKVKKKGVKVGTKWNFDFLEWDALYEYDGKIYRINDFCGIIDIGESNIY